jgi:hypothetical protein
MPISKELHQEEKGNPRHIHVQHCQVWSSHIQNDQTISQHNAREQDVKWVNFDAEKNKKIQDIFTHSTVKYGVPTSERSGSFSAQCK